jgi:hypothetical protein
MPPHTDRSTSIAVQSLMFFVAACLLLLSSGHPMILDSDPLWHLAAGDLIRDKGEIPLSDPWSYTAGDYRWLNVSWLWDIVFSWAYEHWGWQGPIGLNIAIISATLALVYANCLLRTHHGIASFLTVLLLFIMYFMHLRPLQVTHLMVALWMLVLGMAVREECRARWLVVLPLSMLLWVNSHGGFFIGLVLLGGYLTQSVVQKNRPQAVIFLVTLLGFLLAVWVNPYGTGILETVWRPMTTVANQLISEWQPFHPSLGNYLGCMFVVLFVAMVIGRHTKSQPCEAWLAYGALFYGLTTGRFLTSFTIIAAPMLAYRLAYHLKPTDKASPLALSLRAAARNMVAKRSLLLAVLLVALAIATWLPTRSAGNLFPPSTEYPDLTSEIDFITQHYPDARFLNEFTLGGYLVFQARGRVPVFIDPRTETAFPKEVMQHYLDFHQGKLGWESLLEQYRISGIIVPSGGGGQAFHERFQSRKGWKKVFEGKTATLYVRANDSY